MSTYPRKVTHPVRRRPATQGRGAPPPRPATPAGAGEGVTFPEAGGSRPTTPTGRGILADAARAVDVALAERIESTVDWRSGYVRCLHELTAASADPPASAGAIAEAGLASLHARMVLNRDGGDGPLDEAFARAQPGVGSQTVLGEGEPVTELRLPYRGRQLAGAALIEQLERWRESKVIEPSVVGAIREVAGHPEWLSLPGRRVAVIGAAAEIGPLEPLCAWGAAVIAIDLPTDDLQRRITRTARRGAGTVTVPAAADGTRGADLIHAMPEVTRWLEEAAGGDALVLGNYAYADGGLHVRVTAAFDVLAGHLLRHRPGTAISGLATPTDAFVVPGDVISDAHRAWRSRGTRRLAQVPLRLLSAGRLFAPAYATGEPVADVLISQQGPNYALAKRLQRWRALVADQRGVPVSFNVAPPSWTRSVLKNRVLAAAYAGARHFGVEIFPPDTARVLMAALLVHDLNRRPPPQTHPEALFTECAVHGGLWRGAYDPRSVLPIAAVAGLPSSLRRLYRR